jgi:hypothetical protein
MNETMILFRLNISIPSPGGNKEAPKTKDAKQKERVEARRNGTRNIFFFIFAKENTFAYAGKNH